MVNLPYMNFTLQNKNTSILKYVVKKTFNCLCYTIFIGKHTSICIGFKLKIRCYANDIKRSDPTKTLLPHNINWSLPKVFQLSKIT